MKDKFLVFGGLFMFIVSLIGVRNGYLDNETLKYNHKVKVNIIGFSKYRRNDYFLDIVYKSDTIIKSTNGHFYRKYKDAKQVEMYRSADGKTYIFDGEIESDNDYAFGIILTAVSLIIIYKGWKGSKH